MKNVIYLILVALLVFTSCKKDSNPTSPSEDASTVTYSGKVYHTVKIGNQTWLKENLDVGVMIQSTANQSNNGTIEKYCYNNDTANCTKYGGLYQWDEAMAYDTANGTKGICPTGWHIPMEAEFETLMAKVGNDGNKLKREDQGTGSGLGTNTSGFSVLLAGSHYDDDFNDLGDYGRFWSSTEESDAPYACAMTLWNIDGGINDFYYNKGVGCSIRCIKDN